MTGAVPCHEPEANEARSQPTPQRSNQSDNAAPCGYAALGWSASTWRLQIGLNNLPGITSTPATQPLSKRPLSGSEPDTTDNSKQLTGTFAVNIGDGANPSAGTINLTVDEKDLDAVLDAGDLQIATTIGTINTASPEETDSGTLVFSAGSDAITSILFGATGSIVVQDENGAPIAVVWSGSGTGIRTGTIDGVTVIILALSGDGTAAAGGTANVTVTATLTDAFPHADGLSGDVTITGILVIATNSDVDTGIGTVNVTVLDDAPAQLLPDDTVLLNIAGDPGSTDTEELNFIAGADGVGGIIFLGQNGGADDVDGVQALSKDGTPSRRTRTRSICSVSAPTCSLCQPTSFSTSAASLRKTRPRMSSTP